MKDLVVPMPLNGLHIHCDCGCGTNIYFKQFEPDEPWFVYVTDERYPIRCGPFRREQPVQIELVLDKPGTVDALIAALQQVRRMFGQPPSSQG